MMHIEWLTTTENDTEINTEIDTEVDTENNTKNRVSNVDRNKWSKGTKEERNAMEWSMETQQSHYH